MKTALLTVLAACCAAGLVAFTRIQEAPAQRLRIGTYDSRSIAIAYAASEFNAVREKMTEMQAARAAADENRVRALEQWGRDHQVQLHFQGFGDVNVSDLLVPVQGELPAVADRHGLIAIVDKCDFTAANVEVVDVTEELVKLYKPSERTLKQALEIRSHERVPLHNIAKMDPLD